MHLFTHCANREIKKDVESTLIEIGGNMEGRVNYSMLLEAAILETNIEVLLRLLQGDQGQAILAQVMGECEGKDNPLHVGALHGKVSFVRAILNKRPELSRKLNSEGQSPLHLASSRGHVEVVREILSKNVNACLTRELNSEGQSPMHLASERGHVEVVNVILRDDPDACFIRDRDGMIPLHLAAVNGRVEVLDVLVRDKKFTAFILTKSGEPILHLCAYNKKFKALKRLIELVRDVPGFLNLRDRDKNTILHLLVAKEQLEVIQFLLKTPGVVDVNAKNVDGFTPLQVSLLQNENPLLAYRIRLLLAIKGAESDGIQNKSLFADLIKKMEMPGNGDSRFGEALMVVAILMATVAFQARLSPPGGVWPDTTFHNATLPNVTQSSPPPNLVPHYAGKSIMSYVDSRSYQRFSICNDITLSSSLLVIQLLLANYVFKTKIWQVYAVIFTTVSLLTMSLAYSNSAAYISLRKSPILRLVEISSMILYFYLVYSSVMCKPPSARSPFGRWGLKVLEFTSRLSS